MVPGGHVSLRFTDPERLAAAARVFPGSTRDDDAFTLQVASDGGVRSLRALLDHLDRAGIEADELTVHTPDLDDVFLSLTGRPAEQQRELAR
jgi:ABC-2 type transport system ATP-binding protein